MSACASGFASSSPMELESKSNEERQVLTLRARESVFDTSAPIEFEPKSKEESERGGYLEGLSK